jgi:isoleucyl-tRNA synthetase
MDTVTAAYDAYRFHVAYHAIYDYIVTDLSAIYLDALKDRLYSDAAKSIERRSAQTVLLNILEVLVRQLAPILSFTCDEVWDYYPAGIKTSQRVPAVAMAGWPCAEDFVPQLPAPEAIAILQSFEVLLDTREAVTKALEDARGNGTIGKSQEAAVLICAPREVFDVLAAQPQELLTELFITATVAIQVADEVSVTISRAAGEKCPRCWNIRQLGGSAAHPDVCPRCSAVLTGLGL